MPQLPEAIWRTRLASEATEMRATAYAFSVSPGLDSYVVRFRANGLCLEAGAVKPRADHDVRIVLKREYPYPGGIDVTWLSPIFHPNIRRTDGKVCIHLLRAWSSMQTVKSVVAALQQLVEHPNPNDPLDIDAARYFHAKGATPSRATPSAPRAPRIIR